VIELPTNLCFTSIWLVGCGQPGGLRGVRGGAESVSAHVRDGRCLSGRSGGSHGCGGVSLLCWDATLEAATDPLGGAHIATCECPCPGYQFTRTSIAWSGRLEDVQHVLGAVRRPRRQRPPIGFAQRLRGRHSQRFLVRDSLARTDFMSVGDISGL